MLPHGGLDLRPGFTLSHMEWLSSGVDLVELEVCLLYTSDAADE